MVRVLPFAPLEAFSLLHLVVVTHDVRSQVVQEGSGVRGADNAAHEGYEPVLKPPDVIL